MRSPSSIAETPLSMAYVPGPVERFGRKLKVEYLGMVSVYSIIGLLFVRDFYITQGEFLSLEEDEQEIVLVVNFAEENEMKVGETVELLASDGLKEFKIVGYGQKGCRTNK